MVDARLLQVFGWIVGLSLPAGASAASPASTPAQAPQVFLGVSALGVDTPFTLKTGEGGTNFTIGYRFAAPAPLKSLGQPQPYILASLNSGGDTSFLAAGLSWTLGHGPLYFRPGLGLAVHDGPSKRVDPVSGVHTELGSRVLFEPEIGIGYRLSHRLSVEANWMHLSHARLFNSQQNPGLDMIGARVNLAF